jgi:3-methyladenine DNA glycosylase AlkD
MDKHQDRATNLSQDNRYRQDIISSRESRALPEEGEIMKSSRTIPFDFVLEQLEPLSPITRPMFGCTAIYVGEKIMLILRSKEDGGEDNGVWLATTAEHHESLKQEFPSMRSIRMFGPKPSGWQVLPSSVRDFENSVARACELILIGDNRIGKVPKQKRIRPRKESRRSSLKTDALPKRGAGKGSSSAGKAPRFDTETLAEIIRKLEGLADPSTERVSRSFFKTAPGEYGERDQFRGIRVPALRKLSRDYGYISLSEIDQLLRSAFHEDRLLSLMLLVRLYSTGDEALRSRIYRLYLEKTQFINNWDLVDASAEQIVGAHLLARSRRPLYRLAHSKSLWERRIAIISTFLFIKRREFDETLKIAEMLLADEEDLIHKAVGWMLREVGKRDENVMKKFLRSNYRRMPRVMLRYAIEKLPEAERQRYLKGSL